MTRPALISMLLCISACGFDGPRWAVAQTAEDTSRTRQVQVRSADLLDVDRINGEQVRRLLGNVVLLQETTTLRADSAIQYLERNLIVFDGSVEIVDEGDTLRADAIEYRSDRKIANGSGNVVWTDGAVELSAPSGVYMVDEKIASFSGEVVMRDSNSVITSRAGVYEVNDETARFSDTVRLVQEGLVLTADSLLHARQTGLTRAAGSVRIYEASSDTTGSKVLLVAGQAESDMESRTNRLWDDPVLVRVTTSGDPDTLVVSGERLVAATSDSLEWFEAVGAARMWRPDLAAIADSISYVKSTESDTAAVLFQGGPVLWSDDAQVSGDTVRVTLRKGSPDRLDARGAGFVAFEDTASRRIQQIKGTRVVADFDGDSLRSMVVAPQAEALYFGGDRSQDSAPDEEESAVRFSSSSIRIEFEQSEIGKIVASTDVTGQITKFRPENPPALEGFRWLLPNRPNRNDMLSERLLAAFRDWPDGTGGN